LDFGFWIRRLFNPKSKIQNPKSPSRLRPQVIVLGFVSLLNDTASEMIYPILPLFLTATLGATPVIIGVIEGLADAAASLLKYLAGWWSDRLPRRKPLIAWGYALATASRGLIAIAGAWAAVLAARLIDRTGKGIRSAPRDALISDITEPEARGRAYGFQRALDHTGAIAGPLITMALMGWLHFETRSVFALAVIPGFIGVLLIVFVLREPAGVREHAVFEKREQATALPRGFWYYMGAVGLFSLANSSDAFLLLQAHRAGVAAPLLPLLWAAHHVVKSLFTTQAGALSDRMGRRMLIGLGWLSYAAIYFFFPFAQTLTAFFILFVLYAVPFTLFEGAERALIADFVPVEARGKSFGIFYLVNGLGVLAGSALFGFLYQTVSARVAFTSGAALALSAAATLALLRTASSPLRSR
jgi:MFS family permease